MANPFNIVITATDKATGTIKKVNESFDKLTRPFDEVGKSFKALGAEAAAGKLGKGIKAIGGVASKTANSIAKIVTPVAALTSAASIGGVLALADSWAKFGRSVAYSAQAIGITTTQFQQMQQLGTLAGVGADAMTSSLENLGTTMEAARWGRNQPAMMMLQRLGIGLKKTKEGAWDVVGEMKAVAKVMQAPGIRDNPYVQKLIAEQLGLTSILPFLRQGEQGIARYEAMQKRLGYTSSPEAIANANRFAESLAGLKISVEGLGQAVLDKAMPALRPFVDKLAQWVSAHRDLIATDIGNMVEKVATYIQNINWDDVGKGVDKFLDDVKEGLGDVSELASDILEAFRTIKQWHAEIEGGKEPDEGKPKGWIESLDIAERQNIPGYAALSDWINGAPNARDTYKEASRITTGVDPRKRDQVIDYFKKQGYPEVSALALGAAAMKESSLNPTAGLGTEHFGLFQWDAARQQQLRAFAKSKGLDPNSTEAQLAFHNWELQHGDDKTRQAGAQLMQAKTLAQASQIDAELDERVANPGSLLLAKEVAVRTDIAEQFAKSRGGMAAAPAPAPASATAAAPAPDTSYLNTAPSGLYGGGAPAPAAPSQVHLFISTDPRVSAKVTKQADNVQVKPTIGFPAVGGAVG